MQNFKNWCVHALLHAILACAHGIANTHDTQELTLGLPHYTCGVTTGTVAVGNEILDEIQLLCSWLASLYVVMSIAW